MVDVVLLMMWYSESLAIGKTAAVTEILYQEVERIVEMIGIGREVEKIAVTIETGESRLEIHMTTLESLDLTINLAAEPVVGTTVDIIAGATAETTV